MPTAVAGRHGAWFPLAPGRSLYYTWHGRNAVYTFFGEGGASDRMELRNSKLIVLVGRQPGLEQRGQSRL